MKEFKELMKTIKSEYKWTETSLNMSGTGEADSYMIANQKIIIDGLKDIVKKLKGER